MTQNIYDQSEFFAGYSELNRSVRGLDVAVEGPEDLFTALNVQLFVGSCGEEGERPGFIPSRS